MNLGESLEDYLEAILILHKQKGYVRSVDVARHMNFSKPSVCHAVKELRKKGYLEMDSEGYLCLNEKGMDLAQKIYERHCFFKESLIAAGVQPKQAEQDACRIEHVISEESYQKLRDNLLK